MKNFTRVFKVAAICLVLVGLTAPWSQADTYEIIKDIDLYGSLNQNTLINPWGPIACGPVAAINSFTYLQNKYPTIYGKLLVSNIPANDAVTLAGPNYMNTQVPPANPTGTFLTDFIYGKYHYIEDRVAGKTIYGAESVVQAWSDARPKPAWVKELPAPTWQYMYSELKKCEDVEILLSWTGGGHYLTLTSFHFNDIDNDRIIDLGEQAWIDYMDPATGAWGQSAISPQTGFNGTLETDYHGGAYISMIASESPVPLPPTLVLFGSGFIALWGFGRKLRKG